MWSTQSKALAYDWIVFHCMTTPYFVYFFIYPSADAHRLLPLLAIVNNVAINIHLQVFVWMCIFISLECMPSNGSTGLYDDPIFNILRDWPFSKAAALCYIPTSNVRVPVFSHPHQHLSDFLILAILVGVEWDLTVFFICILLMANDVEHLLCAHWPFVYLGELSNQIFYPFLNSVICLFITDL